MLGLHGRIGPTLDGSPSTETRDEVASTSRQYGSEDVLSKMLPRLSHMDLTGRVSNKDAAREAHGGYCDVFVGHVASEYVRHRCVIPTGVGEVKVAIKRLRVRLGKDRQLAKSLAREIGIWSRLNHPNILPLLGYLLEKDYPSLVSEWIENGTVRNFVKNNPECDIMHLALGIAKGLEYMHDMDVVHSDMKGDNVLINQHGEPLICDFGISRMLNSSHTLFVSTTHNGSPKGSTRWMTKELLIPDAGADPKHTKETDVWAYGMTLYEMISKQLPYAHLRSDAQVILAIVMGELPARPPVVDAQPSLFPLWSICTCCWKDQPEAWATVAQIRRIIEQLEMILERDLLPTMTAPPLHKGQLGTSFTGAATLMPSCVQCFNVFIPCDGATPCSNCVRRKSQCNAYCQKPFSLHEDNENHNWQDQNQGQGPAIQLSDVPQYVPAPLGLPLLGSTGLEGGNLLGTRGSNASNNLNFLSPDYGFGLADTGLRRSRGKSHGHRRTALSEQAQGSAMQLSDVPQHVPAPLGLPLPGSTGFEGINLLSTEGTLASDNFSFLSPDYGLGSTPTGLRRPRGESRGHRRKARSEQGPLEVQLTEDWNDYDWIESLLRCKP